MFNQKSLIFRSCVYLILTVLLAVPVLAQVPAGEGTSDYLQGRTDGEMQARAAGGWFFAGFCGGLLGVLIAYMAKPTPSTTMLSGKSQTYVLGYIDGYKDKSASKQANKALVGWGVSCAVWGAVYLVLIAVAVEDNNNNGSWGK